MMMVTGFEDIKYNQMAQSLYTPVIYMWLAAALDSDLWTLFPVESNVERSACASTTALNVK